MDRNEIIARFVSALRTCVKNDRSLIRRKVHERTITASLACYMRPLFREFDVDVEYNRNMESTKSTRDVNNPFPDIIVHIRESNAHNMLIVEAKGHWSTGDRDHDRRKLASFVEDPKFQYRIGIALEFCEPVPIPNENAKFIYTCQLGYYYDGQWHDPVLVKLDETKNINRR